ncbi:hypothetical protein [Nocardia sp. R7R-8]|uniref:hypothetical protein n=1 Tax=Nocardia sp. R7R-8 TaxID=3459304 RepID=UPI00403E0362
MRETEHLVKVIDRAVYTHSDELVRFIGECRFLPVDRTPTARLPEQEPGRALSKLRPVSGIRR